MGLGQRFGGVRVPAERKEGSLMVGNASNEVGLYARREAPPRDAPHWIGIDDGRGADGPGMPFIVDRIVELTFAVRIAHDTPAVQLNGITGPLRLARTQFGSMLIASP